MKPCVDGEQTQCLAVIQSTLANEGHRDNVKLCYPAWSLLLFFAHSWIGFCSLRKMIHREISRDVHKKKGVKVNFSHTICRGICQLSPQCESVTVAASRQTMVVYKRPSQSSELFSLVTHKIDGMLPAPSQGEKSYDQQAFKHSLIQMGFVLSCWVGAGNKGCKSAHVTQFAQSGKIVKPFFRSNSFCHINCSYAFPPRRWWLCMCICHVRCRWLWSGTFDEEGKDFPGTGNQINMLVWQLMFLFCEIKFQLHSTGCWLDPNSRDILFMESCVTLKLISIICILF